tara:strand:+ start:20338 stop:20745 length:408 start_codon:yes stop_codon:yes gene_type:complete
MQLNNILSIYSSSMASTRNNNQFGDYLCKKKQIQTNFDHRMEPLFVKQTKPNHMHVLGTNPSKMSANHFSYNAIDVESTLRGIKSCNLEGPSFKAEMQPKDFYTFELFENHLRNEVALPRPFDHQKNERHGFHNI